VYRTATIQLEDKSTLQAVGAPELAIHTGDLCVVETGRVPEFGRVLRLDDEEGSVPPRKGLATLLRRATLQDQSRANENTVMGRMAAKTVHRRIEEHKLAVRLVQVRYSFDRSILHVTYTADDRVDGGDLARSLASELHARIEMRQIGVRDAARLIGGLGCCGRRLCCQVLSKDFEAVSVKMAKAQRLALNPGTIGGICGRLKCCLKFEFDFYRHQGEKLPKDGARVKSPEGMGRVVDKDVIGQRVKVRLEDGRVLSCEASSVQVLTDASGGEDRKREKKP
jgi:cell fate regulator YaaT (PSP1 superfamily)